MTCAVRRGFPRSMTATLFLGLFLLSAQGRTAPSSPPPPRRVVSLAPSLTEFVFALGSGGSLVGVTNYCDYPPQAEKLPKVGGIEDGSIDFERVLGLKPDLVLAIGEGQSQAVERLRNLGLRVEVVPSQTIDDLLPSLVRLGGLLGRQAEARSLSTDLSQRIGQIRKLTGKLAAARRPRVFFEIWDRPLMTATRNVLAGRLVELAGGVNIFADLPGRYPQVSPEAVLERQPQVIVIPDHHAKRVDPRSRLKGTGLEGTDAVRNGRLLILDGDLVSRVGPRVGDALELLAHGLHPDLVPLAPRGSTAGRRP